ncbi:MAG: cytochrome c [Betaproteobacteria bacterium]
MKKILITIALFMPMSAMAAGNAEAGAKKAETCKVCHGEGGAKPIQPDYPVLAGQHNDYLVAALNQYKSGKRKNATMNGFAAALKPEDIRDLAAYFSSQKSDLKTKY